MKTKLELEIEFEAKLAFVIERCTELAYSHSTASRESYLKCVEIFKKTQAKIPNTKWNQKELIAWLAFVDELVAKDYQTRNQI